MRTTAPSPAAFRISNTGLSPKIVHENEPVRSPSSTLKNALPFAAVLAASFFTTSRLANARPFASAPSAFSSRTIDSMGESGMRLHELGVRFEKRMFHVVQERIKHAGST